jgi:hypothetical protein
MLSNGVLSSGVSDIACANQGFLSYQALEEHRSFEDVLLCLLTYESL